MAALLEKLVPVQGISDEVASLAERVRASVVVVQGRSGSGSGVVWNGDGLVVTNHHVVPGDRALVTSASGVQLPARVTRRSASYDLAALQVEGDHLAGGFTPASIGDSNRLRPGDLVIAVGNPHGEQNAVTLGIVSSVGRIGWIAEPREAIQVAITLRPGNSGGALADARGNVVGIPNMVIHSGLALAVPGNVVERFLAESPRQRGRLGLAGLPVRLPAGVVDRLGLSDATGMLIVSVESGGSAELAGLIVGDVIVRISQPAEDGASVDLFTRLGRLPAGQPLDVAFLRGSELHELEVASR